MFLGAERAAVASVVISVSDGEAAASDFAWSPDGLYVAVLSRLLRKVSVFDTATGQLIGHLENLAGARRQWLSTPAAMSSAVRQTVRPMLRRSGTIARGAALAAGPDGSTTDSSGNKLLEFAVDRKSNRLLGVYQLPAGATERVGLAFTI